MKDTFRIIAILFFLFLPILLNSQEVNKKNMELIRSIAHYKDCNSYLGSWIQKRKILKKSDSFDEIARAIKTGDIYKIEETARGSLKWSYTIDSLEHNAIVIIPANYDSAKQYAVEVVLHGGASNPNPYAFENYLTLSKSELEKIDEIIIYPAAWLLSPWWSKTQLKNLRYLLRRIKRNYNIDENRVALSGISDGGTGCVYTANFCTTPWSCFLPYISNPSGIPRLSSDALYLQNLGNRSFFFISTEKDPLFPPEKIQNFIRKMKENENPYQLAIVPNYAHDTKWFNDYRDSIRQFKKAHIRNPFPDSLNWYCKNTEYGRAHWVIIDKIGRKTENSSSEKIIRGNNFDPPTHGAIQVVRKGNDIFVKTHNVKRYRLLISHEQFNFNEELKVYTNGALSYAGKPKKNPGVLLKWYWKDLDRSMLFASELKIKVK